MPESRCPAAVRQHGVVVSPCPFSLASSDAQVRFPLMAHLAQLHVLTTLQGGAPSDALFGCRFCHRPCQQRNRPRAPSKNLHALAAEVTVSPRFQPISLPRSLTTMANDTETSHRDPDQVQRPVGDLKRKRDEDPTRDGSWFTLRRLGLASSVLTNLLLLVIGYVFWCRTQPPRLPSEEDLSGSFVADGIEADEIAIGKFRATRLEGGKITLKFGPGSLVVEQSGEDDDLKARQTHEGGRESATDSMQPEGTDAKGAESRPNGKLGG